jgi:hypothetical protein
VALNSIGTIRQATPGYVAKAALTATSTGEFAITGIMPGRYLVDVRVPSGGVGPPWTASSILVNGREVIDTGLEITGDEHELTAVVTLTDRVAEISGTFQDATGQPAAGYTIILYAADRTAWAWQSRRIKAVRPSSDGKFVIANLPAGDYFLTAVTDVEPDEWFDPAFLEPLLPSSIRLSIAEGERKVQNIRIR